MVAVGLADGNENGAARHTLEAPKWICQPGVAPLGHAGLRQQLLETSERHRAALLRDRLSFIEDDARRDPANLELH
jgi:hypothetical protein